MPPDLNCIRHVVLDMDGTIYKGSRLFACTLPFLALLRDTGIGYTFLTNNTSRSKADYVAKLCAFGIDYSVPERVHQRALQRERADPAPAALGLAQGR